MRFSLKWALAARKDWKLSDRGFGELMHLRGPGNKIHGGISMRRALLAAPTLLAAVLATSNCGAMWTVSNKGNWPASWPAQLEPLRSQSRTLSHGNYTMYHIPFTDQTSFESAWPHLLSIATKGAPLTLWKGHDRWTAVDFDAGVVIFAPNIGEQLVFDDDKLVVYPPSAESSTLRRNVLTVGPPWPAEIRDKSGILPEYVIPDGLKWQPITIEEMRGNVLKSTRARRARTEIRLIVDGKIVDLNSIPLPASVIDKRFEEKPSR